MLLVEFVNDDPFNQHRVEALPFVAGFLRERGVAVEWLALQAGRSARPLHPYVVDLATGELAEAAPAQLALPALVDAISSFRPSHVAFNERLGAGLAAAIDEALAGAQVLAGEPSERILPWLAAELALDLELDDPTREPALPGGAVGESLYDLAIPDYACRHLDPGPGPGRYMLRVVAGPPCMYRRPVQGNPFFEAVSLEGMGRTGCSFCAHPEPDDADRRMSAPLDKALVQLRRFVETAPPERRGCGFVLEGSAAFLKLDAFLKGLLALEIVPSAFYLTCRIDELLAREETLRRHLPELKQRGHSLHIWNIGLESFSERENQRFNKGISAGQAERAVLALRALEADWPESFFWSQHGGFGMISFTPWTRLDDIDANIDGLGRLSLDGMVGMLSTRLQLLPGTALLALARRDGLTLEAEDIAASEDAALPTIDAAMSCLTSWSIEEIPWRFKHPDTAAVYALLSRLQPPGGGPPDAEVAGVFTGGVRVPEPLELAATLVSLARSQPGASREELQRALRDRLCYPAGDTGEPEERAQPALASPGTRNERTRMTVTKAKTDTPARRQPGAARPAPRWLTSFAALCRKASIPLVAILARDESLLATLALSDDPKDRLEVDVKPLAEGPDGFARTERYRIGYHGATTPSAALRRALERFVALLRRVEAQIPVDWRGVAALGPEPKDPIDAVRLRFPFVSVEEVSSDASTAGAPGERTTEKGTERGAESGVEILVRLTPRCNQDCPFCSGPPHQEPSGEALSALFAWIPSRFPGALVTLTGGEPTLRADFAALCRAALANEGIEALQIQSNAVSFASKARLASLPTDPRMRFFVSLHAVDATIYDRCTGTSAQLAPALEGIRGLLGAGHAVTINVVVSQLNLAHLASLVEALPLLFEGLPMPLLHFSVLICPEYRPDAAEYLVPYRELVPALEAAHARALALGVPVDPLLSSTHASIPRCLLPEEQRSLDERRLLLRPEETGTDEEGRDWVKGASCGGCAADGFCLGVPRAYAQRYGLDELQPIRPSGAREV